jgi:uncharacterized protein
MKTRILFLVIILVGMSARMVAQDIPDPPNPPRLVNDYAGVLTQAQADALEQKLVRFNDTTSTQITVVIVKTLFGYDKNDFAQRLGQKWGVGQKGRNNGIVVLVKPKYATEKGEVAIQTGYGIEGVLPDVTCKQIVNNEMIPRFEEGDYYAGIDAGVSTVMAITHGEYTADQYGKRHQEKPYGIVVPIIILIVVALWVRMGRARMHSVGKNIPFWTAFWLLGSMGRGHGGSWGGFSGGSGGFGGGGGGFGGFGGGGFGGGGAGGSW